MPTKKTATKKVAKKKVAKKATKKAVKKTTRKKSVSKKTKRDLVYADGATAFWVRNGRVLDSLLALGDALAEMENEVYKYHVKKGQNDFADWVESVLADNECAKALKKAKTPKTAKTVVVRHLKLYSV